MPKASELKKGMVIEVEGMPHSVKQIEARSPSSRGAVTIYKVRFLNLQNGTKLDSSFKGSEILSQANFDRVPIQYSYCDAEIFYFMNTDNFNQYELTRDQLTEQLPFLTEQQENIFALISNEQILTIELPQSVDLLINDTPPAISGSSATNRTKTATLSTGLEIQVPEYLKPGDLIKVNTITGKYISRA